MGSVVPAGGEGKGMPKAIIGLGHVLSDETFRGMAIVAGGNGTVAGLNPGRVVLIHDMAIRTGPLGSLVR